MITHRSPGLPPASCPDLFQRGEDMEAARAALLHVASSIPRPTVRKLSALLYLADRVHLSRSSALIFGSS